MKRNGRLAIAILVLRVSARGEEILSLGRSAKIAMTLGDEPGARQILSIALKADPSSIEPLFLSGEIDEREGRV